MDMLLCHRDGLVSDAIRSVLNDDGVRVTVAKTVDVALELAPTADVCLIDVHVDNALETITRLAASVPGPRVLALVDDSRDVRAAVGAGASGWVTTSDGLDRLVRMLKTDLQSPEVPRPKPGDVSRRPERSRDKLTAREVEVLGGLVRGESTKLLAARLNVTPATARTHVQNVLGKLGVHSRLQAVALVVEQSLLSSQPGIYLDTQGGAVATGA